MMSLLGALLSFSCSVLLSIHHQKVFLNRSRDVLVVNLFWRTIRKVSFFSPRFFLCKKKRTLIIHSFFLLRWVNICTAHVLLSSCCFTFQGRADSYSFLIVWNFMPRNFRNVLVYSSTFSINLSVIFGLGIRFLHWKCTENFF